MPRNPENDRPWTEAETTYLLSHHATESLGQIGKALGRTRSAVGGKASRLGLASISSEETQRRSAHGTRAAQRYAPPVVIKPLKEPRTRRSPAVVALAVAAANDDPAARAAEALLSNARSAEQRRDGFRSGFGRSQR